MELKLPVWKGIMTFLEKQLNNAVAEKSQSAEYNKLLQSVEALYSPELNATVVDELASFFDALNILSSSPEELHARTAVKERGKNLALSFNNLDSTLKGLSSDINSSIKTSVSDINNILKNLSILNSKVHESEADATVQANDLRDQRDRLLGKLSEFMDLTYYEDQHGMLTIRGPGNVLLMDKSSVAHVEAIPSKTSGTLNHIMVRAEGQGSATDITEDITTGRLKAELQVRDEVLAGLISKNNEMAYKLITKFNEYHRQGFGLNDFSLSKGRNFFKNNISRDDAARNIGLDSSVINSVNAISVASVPASPADNVIANRLIELQDEKIFLEKTASFNEFYSNYASIIGADVVRSKYMLDSDTVVHSNLQAQTDSLTGVSLDEEATNLLRWQTMFNASSKVITTVDEMLQTLFAIKR